MRGFARVHKVWSRARIDAEVKLKVDAVSRAHGEIQTSSRVHDSILPSQSYFESFEERLCDGRLMAETLCCITT